MNVNLSNLIDALNRQTDRTTLYLDRATGEIIVVTDEAAALAADKVEWEDLPDEQQAVVQTALAVARSRRGEFVELPSTDEVNERTLMRAFIDDITLNHPVAAEDLTGALRSRSADSPRFRETAARYGLGEEWNRFRAEARCQILLAWCDENGLEAED